MSHIVFVFKVNQLNLIQLLFNLLKLKSPSLFQSSISSQLINTNINNHSMSLSTTIPSFNTLPLLFTSQLILQIQLQVTTPSDLHSILSSYSPNFPPSKTLPILKEQFFKNLIQKQPIQQTITNLYSYMTQKSYTIEEKTHVVNVVYKLVYLISEIGMNKEKWKNIMNFEVKKLVDRFYSFTQHENNENSQKYVPPVLTPYQAQDLRIYISTNILPFYELWEKLLDQNQYFLIESKTYEPTRQQEKCAHLSSGKKLQVNQIMDLDFLKDYLGEKPPVQEKKDPKKK